MFGFIVMCFFGGLGGWLGVNGVCMVYLLCLWKMMLDPIFVVLSGEIFK